LLADGGTATLTGTNTYVPGGTSETLTETDATVTSSSFTLSFKADVAGSYTILVSAGHSAYTPGDKTVAVTITTVGAPTSMTVALYAGTVTTVSTNGGKNGAVYKVNFKDANGNATILGANESVDISESTDHFSIAKKANTGTFLAPTYAALSSFGSASGTGIDTNSATGSYYFRAIGDPSTADGTAIVTLTGSGLLPSTFTTNISIATVASVDVPSAGSVACTTSSTSCTGAGPFSVNGASSLLLTKTGTPAWGDTTVDNVYSIDFKNSAGVAYSSTFTIAAATTAVNKATISTPSVTDAPYNNAYLAFNGASYTLTYAKPVLGGLEIASGKTILSATGGTNTWTVAVTDQYSNALPYTAVYVNVSGRNTVATTPIGVTNASGLITYSLKDIGTVGTQDVVTFGSNAALANPASATVTYGTVTVGSVAVSGGKTVADAGVAGANTTAISAADNGPEGSAVSITATVKDANGNLLAGVPVTFTVSSGLIVKSAAVDYATVYTGSNGKAVTKVFNWVPGTQTITATAGGKSASDYLTWAATDASSARVLSATANGNVVSVKVVDRFGNGVKGVKVSLSRTGTGFFGNGTSTADVTTDKTGTADIQFNGTATVTAELATATYTQSADVAGEIDATAVTAAVAGTTKGTGASLAPAGVNKVTVDLSDTSSAAVDAANEATDAANAATDAANAAAEAADAATAAAQDAQAAVAALATSVASLIAGIKAQITTLTNLVIKIQKKVKA